MYESKRMVYSYACLIFGMNKFSQKSRSQFLYYTSKWQNERKTFVIWKLSQAFIIINAYIYSFIMFRMCVWRLCTWQSIFSLFFCLELLLLPISTDWLTDWLHKWRQRIVTKIWAMNSKIIRTKNNILLFTM